MNEFLIAIGTLLYAFVGVVAAFALENKPDGGEIVLAVLFWPFILMLMLIVGFFSLAANIGTWINKKINK